MIGLSCGCASRTTTVTDSYMVTFSKVGDDDRIEARRQISTLETTRDGKSVSEQGGAETLTNPSLILPRGSREGSVTASSGYDSVILRVTRQDDGALVVTLEERSCR